MMKAIVHALIGAMLMALSQPAAAQCGLASVPSSPGADASAQALAAHDLASLYYPEDMISAVVERQARTGFEQGVRQSPNGERILAELPDLVDVGYAATMRILRPCVARMVPVLQHRAAGILAQRLSLMQLRGVADFYRSDTGRATMAAIARTMRPVEVRMRADGSVAPMTRGDIQSVIPTNFIDLLTPEQVAGLDAFGRSSHGQAFMAATPALEQLSVETINGMNTAVQAEIQAAVQAAITDYMARNPRGRRGN